MPDSNYPAQIDDYSSLVTTEVQADLTNKSAHMRKALAGITAIEQTLGVDPQGSYATVRERIEALEGGEVSYQGTVDTTDATPTTILTIPLPADATVSLVLNVSGRRTGGVDGFPGDGIVRWENDPIFISAGVMNLPTQNYVTNTKVNLGGADVTISQSGANLLVKVTGTVDNDVTWLAKASVLIV